MLGILTGGHLPTFGQAAHADRRARLADLIVGGLVVERFQRLTVHSGRQPLQILDGVLVRGGFRDVTPILLGSRPHRILVDLGAVLIAGLPVAAVGVGSDALAVAHVDFRMPVLGRVEENVAGLQPLFARILVFFESELLQRILHGAGDERPLHRHAEPRPVFQRIVDEAAAIQVGVELAMIHGVADGVVIGDARGPLHVRVNLVRIRHVLVERELVVAGPQVVGAGDFHHDSADMLVRFDRGRPSGRHVVDGYGAGLLFEHVIVRRRIERRVWVPVDADGHALQVVR